MNETPASTEISDQIAALRRQVFVLLLALIIVSGTLVSYLFYQSRVMSKNVEVYRPQAAQIFQNYNQNVPAIQSFVKQLVAFGQTHPDFQKQVLNKYGIGPTNAAAPKK